jgi:flagellar hook-associated protein 1
MSNGLFSIGNSALTATYTALQTTGNNIANANTPGYSRQIVSFTPLVETGFSGTYVGEGVAVDSIKRAYNDLLTQQVNLATAGASQSGTRAKLLGQINNLFSSTSGGLGAAVDQFFSQVQTLTQQPSSLAVRQTVMASAQQMSATFGDAFGQLQLMQQSADQQIGQEISTVNSTTAQIARLNDQISLAAASGGSPNDLLDQRDQAIKTLNQSIGVTLMKQSDGSINVFLANGMGPDPSDAQNVIVGTVSGNSVIPLSIGNSGGGNIGALMQFRLQDIPTVENQIGRLAVVVADQFNQQSKLGQDLNGAAGVNFFSAPTPAVIAATTNATSGGAPVESVSVSFSDTSQLQASDYRLQVSGGSYMLTRTSDGQQTNLSSPPYSLAPGSPAAIDGITISVSGTATNGDTFTIEPVRNGANNLAVAIGQAQQVAAASPIRPSMPSSNTGSLSIASLSVVGPTRNASLTTPVSLNFTGATTYTVGGGPAQTYTPGQPISLNGWSLTLLGTPHAGDQVSVGPNVGGTGDNTNALALAQLQSANVIDGGPLGSGYAAVVAQVGTMTANAQADQQNQQTLLNDAVNAQSAVSGVNLDEEAAKLLQYQQQYQAAAKVISIASTLFNQILSIGA